MSSLKEVRLWSLAERETPWVPVYFVFCMSSSSRHVMIEYPIPVEQKVKKWIACEGFITHKHKNEWQSFRQFGNYILEPFNSGKLHGSHEQHKLPDTQKIVHSQSRMAMVESEYWKEFKQS